VRLAASEHRGGLARPWARLPLRGNPGDHRLPGPVHREPYGASVGGTSGHARHGAVGARRRDHFTNAPRGAWIAGRVGWRHWRFPSSPFTGPHLSIAVAISLISSSRFWPSVRHGPASRTLQEFFRLLVDEHAARAGYEQVRLDHDWPIAEIDSVASLAERLELSDGQLAWLADVRSLERNVIDEKLRNYRYRIVPRRSGLPLPGCSS
jgi:hypothetical protein